MNLQIGVVIFHSLIFSEQISFFNCNISTNYLKQNIEYISTYIVTYNKRGKKMRESWVGINSIKLKKINSIYWHNFVINVRHIKYLLFFDFHINAKLYFILNLNIMQTLKKTSIVRNMYMVAMHQSSADYYIPSWQLSKTH